METKRNFGAKLLRSRLKAYFQEDELTKIEIESYDLHALNKRQYVFMYELSSPQVRKSSKTEIEDIYLSLNY